MGSEAGPAVDPSVGPVVGPAVGYPPGGAFTSRIGDPLPTMGWSKPWDPSGAAVISILTRSGAMLGARGDAREGAAPTAGGREPSSLMGVGPRLGPTMVLGEALVNG